MIPSENFDISTKSELERKTLEVLENLEKTSDRTDMSAMALIYRTLNDVTRGLIDPEINEAIDYEISRYGHPEQTRVFVKDIKKNGKFCMLYTVIRLDYEQAKIHFMNHKINKVVDFETGEDAVRDYERVCTELLVKGHEEV